MLNFQRWKSIALGLKFDQSFGASTNFEILSIGHLAKTVKDGPTAPMRSVENPFEIRDDDELVFPFADSGDEFRLPMHADRRRLL